ncbi:MAG TPA: radical SAM protein [Planctomycetota bacterium]|jgi:cyclic pyranopterin phosphate synthase
MIDAFGRAITYLRISITDRCNLRCEYCMPPQGVPLVAHEDILSYEEIAEVARVAVSMGIEKIRVTGGEPLARRHIERLVALLAAIPGVRDLAMTTNGILLAENAAALKKAGLMRVNVSLDTLNPRRFAQLTRGGELQRVLDGIAAAQAAGLSPIKLNCVMASSREEPDARSVADFGRKEGLEVRYIRRMNLREGRFSIVEGGSGGDCARCNRLRLSCTGVVRPCLFSELGFSVRELGARAALEQALASKPRCGMSSDLSTLKSIGG